MQDARAVQYKFIVVSYSRGVCLSQIRERAGSPLYERVPPRAKRERLVV